MKLFKPPNVNLWSALLDLAVVILGILIAFTLNTWWNNRQNNTIELQLLHDLKTEAQINLAEMEPIFHRLDSTKIAAEQLLILIGPNAEDISVNEFWKLLSPSLGFVTYDATNTTKTSIANNGELKFIRNAEIKQLLSILPAKLNDYTEDEGFTVELLNNILLPYIYTKFPIHSMEYRPAHFPVSTQKVLRDPTFDSYIGMVLRRQNQMLKELLDYQNHILKLIELIEAELGIKMEDAID